MTAQGAGAHSSAAPAPSSAFDVGAISDVQSLTRPNGEAIPVPTQNAAVANPGGDPLTDSSIANIFPSVSPSVTFLAPGSRVTGFSGHPGSPDTGDAPGDGNGTQGGDGGGGDGSAGAPGGNDSSSHHGLSKAVIAVIAAVGALVLMALVVCACRRRLVAKRLARRKRWFRGEKSTSMYGAVSSSGYFRERPPSERSSFGTSYEHQIDPFSAAPPLPVSTDWQLYQPESMAQTRSSLFVTVPSAAATTYSLPSPTFRTSGSRTSSGTYESAYSGPASFESQVNAPQVPVLVIPGRGSDDGQFASDAGTPISVRPFSPSERWSFPKPPASGKRSSMLQPPARTTSTTPDSAATSEYVTAPESENPFLDPTAENSVDGHSDESFLTVDTTWAHFRVVEEVCRPFAPTQGDELAVAPGDSVHVVRRFDDGWAYAQNLSTGGRGLFPIDCLRMPDQDLDTFLAEKQLSAYGGGAVHPPSRAMSRMSTVEEFHAM